MKQYKEEMWKKAPNALGAGKKDMNANEILGKDITMKVGSGSEPGGEGKAPSGTQKVTTLTGVGNKAEKSPKAGAGGGYLKAMSSATEKLSPMAQTVGSSRKGR